MQEQARMDKLCKAQQRKAQQRKAHHRRSKAIHLGSGTQKAFRLLRTSDACISEAQRRFHQTKGTPPMTTPLNIQLGYMGIGDAADRILDGQYESKPGTDPYAEILLKSLSRAALKDDKLEIGISTWKKAKYSVRSFARPLRALQSDRSGPGIGSYGSSLPIHPNADRKAVQTMAKGRRL
jgi:hypothetical protein